MAVARNTSNTFHASEPTIFIKKLLELPLGFVKAKTKASVIDIFDHWERLNWIVARYEPVLQRRWAKKKLEQRRKVLLTAWPAIPAVHRADFDSEPHETLDVHPVGEHFRDVYLLPFVNLEDLCGSKNLLLAFDSRGKNTPDTFALFDLEMQQLRRPTQAITAGFLEGYTMELVGQRTRDSYGRLLSWEEDETAFSMLSTGMGTPPGEGLIILEIQQKFISFLVRCAETILFDMSLDQNSPMPAVPADPPKSLSEDTGTALGSLAAVYSEAHYRVPLQLDFDRLRSLAAAKRAEAEDHIWALREDPGYFQEVLQEYSAHRYEWLATLDGVHHPDLGEPAFFQAVLTGVLHHAYDALIRWDTVLLEVGQLQDLRARHGAAVAPGQALPAEYAEALRNFMGLIDWMLLSPLKTFRNSVVVSPPLRQHFFLIAPGPNAPTSMPQYGRFPALDDRLLRLLAYLSKDAETKRYGLCNLLDELDRLTRSSPRERARISAFTARTLSEMAALVEFQRNFALHQPKAPRPDEERSSKYVMRVLVMARVVFNVFRADLQLLDVGTPFSRFNYPSWKKRTRPVHEQLCAAEADLDRLWAAVDEHFGRLTGTGMTLHQLLEGIIVDREIQRTPLWTEPQPEADFEDTDEVSEVIYTARCFAISVVDERAPAKRKRKTKKARSRAAKQDACEHPEAAPPSRLGTPATVKVSRRAYDAFAALFAAPGEPRDTGELPWKEFRYAMANAGFAVERLTGSACAFLPKDEWGGSPIIFHEPHPGNRIRYYNMRAYARRLRHAYGWDSCTFELKGTE